MQSRPHGVSASGEERKGDGEEGAGCSMNRLWISAASASIQVLQVLPRDREFMDTQRKDHDR